MMKARWNFMEDGAFFAVSSMLFEYEIIVHPWELDKNTPIRRKMIVKLNNKFNFISTLEIWWMLQEIMFA
jgi:hypothetical protein